MTNYSERLDDVLDNVLIGMYCTNPDGDFVPLDDRNNVLRVEAKQALKQLTKELVAEAKPEDNCMGCNGVMQFKQNLLKALEEV